jgi:beta-phosphoglucomutase-like phosphatase (HAD superfamily)
MDTVVIDFSAFDAFLFDLDGVITRRAGLHASAWKTLFDEYLQARGSSTGTPFGRSITPSERASDRPKRAASA